MAPIGRDAHAWTHGIKNVSKHSHQLRGVGHERPFDTSLLALQHKLHGPPPSPHIATLLKTAGKNQANGSAMRAPTRPPATLANRRRQQWHSPLGGWPHPGQDPAHARLCQTHPQEPQQEVDPAAMPSTTPKEETRALPPPLVSRQLRPNQQSCSSWSPNAIHII